VLHLCPRPRRQRKRSRCCCKSRCVRRTTCLKRHWISPASTALCPWTSRKMGLANYFAGAALMPIWPLSGHAQSCLNDLRSLRAIRAAIETGTRTGSDAANAPDQRHSVLLCARWIKPHDSSANPFRHALQFARFGGACPLWKWHSASKTPRPVFCASWAEDAGAVANLVARRDISKPDGGLAHRSGAIAISLGCEVPPRARAGLWPTEWIQARASAFETGSVFLAHSASAKHSINGLCRR